MTECNRLPLAFSSLSRRKISADFDGGRLTSDAGGLLLREVDRKIGLTQALSECIADPRDPDKVIHDVQTMLAQRIHGIALGYEDLNDHQTLRSDPVMQTLAERVPDEESPLASPATLCRFENRITRQCLARMSGVLVDQFIASFKRPPKELILDFDATDDRVHGDQEGNSVSSFILPHWSASDTLSTAITTTTASHSRLGRAQCRSTCSPVIVCSAPTCDAAISTPRCTAGRSCVCWSIACARSGRR